MTQTFSSDIKKEVGGKIEPYTILMMSLFSSLKHCWWTTTLVTTATTGKVVDPLRIFETNFHGLFILLPTAWLTTNRPNIIRLSPVVCRNCRSIASDC
jgi:hypothetical protein